MQAILVKYLGPTDTKGARYKATVQAGSITLPNDDRYGPEKDALEDIRTQRGAVVDVDDVRMRRGGAWNDPDLGTTRGRAQTGITKALVTQTRQRIRERCGLRLSFDAVDSLLAIAQDMRDRGESLSTMPERTDYWRSKKQKQRDEARARGDCTMCCTRPAAPSCSTCKECQEKANKRKQKRVAS